MYSLYDMRKLKPILSDELEKNIYKEVCKRYKKDENERLLITRRVNNGDEIICSIRCKEDFEEYVRIFGNKLLKEETCVELKEEILDLADKPKVKTYKLPK